MNITEKINNLDVELVVSGRVDTNTAPQLEAKIKDYMKKCLELVVDMSDVEYISSAGLRVILAGHKMAGKEKRFILKKPSAFCMQVLEATGMAPLLNIKN